MSRNLFFITELCNHGKNVNDNQRQLKETNKKKPKVDIRGAGSRLAQAFFKWGDGERTKKVKMNILCLT